MSKLRYLIYFLLIVGAITSATVVRVDAKPAACGQVQSAICDASTENLRSSAFIKQLTNTLLFLLGVAAVVAIIIGGIRYATADGDASKITLAKNTILYAVIGLIIAIMAWGIVSFVVERISPTQTTQQSP